MQFNAMLPGQAVIPLGVAIGHLILGIYVWGQQAINRDHPFQLYLVYLALTVFWNVNLVVLVTTNGRELLPGITGVNLSAYGLIALGVLYWAFSRAFLQLRWQIWWGWTLASVIFVLALCLDLRLIPISADWLNWSNGWLYPQNLGFTLSAATWGVLMGSTLVTGAIQQYRTQSPAHRNRIQFLLIAIALLLLGYGLFLSLVEPMWTAGLIVTWVGGGLTAYIVIIEDLVDLSVAARRTVSRLVTVVVSIIVYVAGIYLVQIFLGDLLAASVLVRFADPILLVAAVTAVLLTIVYIPIQRVSRRLTNRFIFGQSYDYQHIIQTYTQTISNILYLDELARAALDHLKENFGFNRGALFLLEYESDDHYHFRSLPVIELESIPHFLMLTKETAITRRLVAQGQPLAQYNVDISTQFRDVPESDRETLRDLALEWFVPILKKDELIGVFGIGAKRSKQRYGVQDVHLLKTLADQTALALENASLVDRLQRNLSETNRMKNLMNNVFDSMQSGVITADLNGRITFFNRAAASILGLSTINTIGKSYQEALPSLAETIFDNLVKNVVERSQQYTNYEIRSDLPDRGNINLNLHLAPLRDVKDQITGVTVLMDDITETKRLQAVQDMFRRYVSPAVVDRLPADPSKLELGGHRQVVTILFADIRGFTEYSEYMDPEKLVDTLNEYLSMAASAILMYEGTLDKFVGDAIMGIFNAPLEQDDHVLRATRAALAMQRSIRQYHLSIGQDRALSFGIGIHIGEAVVGNVGMSDRMDYTAIGDTVNLAKRIQENSPGDTILMSEAAYTAVKNSISASFYKELHVKGREQAVTTYEVTGD